MKIQFVYLRKCPQPVRVHLPGELDIETEVKRDVSAVDGDFEDIKTQSTTAGYITIPREKIVEVAVTPNNMKMFKMLIDDENPMFRLRYEEDRPQIDRYTQPAKVEVEAEEAEIVEPEVKKAPAKRGRPKKAVSLPKTMKVEKATPAGENE